MDKEIIFLVEEDAEGGFTARALGHGIFTEADNLKELKARIQDAVRCHFDELEKPQLYACTSLRTRLFQRETSQGRGWPGAIP